MVLDVYDLAMPIRLFDPQNTPKFGILAFESHLTFYQYQLCYVGQPFAQQAAPLRDGSAAAAYNRRAGRQLHVLAVCENGSLPILPRIPAAEGDSLLGVLV